MPDVPTLTAKLAELAVWGANVQPGQIVGITSSVGKEELTRLIARAAYRRGAKYVDVLYWDAWVKRERVDLAAEETLDYVPPWLSERLFWLSDEHAARVTLSGPQAPNALLGLDPARAGTDMLPRQRETRRDRQPDDDELVHRPRADPRPGPRPSTRTSRPMRRTRPCGRRSRTSAGWTRTTRPRRGRGARTS